MPHMDRNEVITIEETTPDKALMITNAKNRLLITV